MQGKYKSKGIKKVTKIKKYTSGTEGLDLTKYSQVGGIAGGLGALGIEGLTASKYDGKYTSQLKDENQAIGRGIGAAAGQGLDLLVPGLGSIATPLLSSAGGAIQRGFQGDKLEGIKKNAEYKDKVEKANQNIQTDLTAFQAKQYTKGSAKTKTKVIEIEGKGTPEIHTDKNFNLKNLGTTPHSKGGNKVVAEEGDIVFPTQNSPKKYNEIIDAVMKKDKYKLKKEQNKLPEDKSSKYVKGTPKVKVEDEDDYMDFTPYKSALGVLGEGLSGLTKATIGGSAYNSLTGNKKADKGATINPKRAESTGTKAATTTTKVVSTPNVKAGKQISTTPTTNSVGKIQAKTYPDGSPMPYDEQNRSKQYNKYEEAKEKGVILSRNDPRNKYGIDKVGAKNAVDVVDLNGSQYLHPEGMDLMENRMTTTPNKLSISEKVKPLDIPKKEVPIVEEEDVQFKNKYNPLELASTAYNLGTGLFGKAEKVNRKEYNPALEQYVDTSSNLRREVNSGYKGALSNARNLSAGNANNFRANAQAAANSKFDQVNKIDSQEYGKQLDVNNRNVDRINRGKETNIDLFNKYEDLDAQNRAAKTNSLTTGIDQLSEIGGRSNLQRNALSNQRAVADLLKNNYKVDIDANGQAIGGTQFQQGGGATYSNNQFPSSSVKTKTPKKEKGSKSINVVRKYKLI